MAVWQYEILLLPKVVLSKIFHDIPRRLDNHDLEEFDWWDDTRPPKDYAEVLGRFLPVAETWSQDIQIWGEQDGNRVQVVKQQECVVEIAAFIDVRNLDMRFIEALVDFADRCNCLLVTDDMTLLEANPYELLSKIEDSTAVKYVENPERLLDLLKQRDQWRLKRKKGQ